jgi:hypothetical protein
MGFRLRKSINLGGGFRINLSKSGIGYGWGVPGYRITKTAKGTTRRTYSIPGTGISYVEESGRRQNSRDNARNVLQPSQRTREIESADIKSFKAAEIGNITSAVERTIRLNKLSTFLIVCIILAPAYPALTVLPIIGIILKIIAHRAGPVQLEYTLDDDREEEYNRRVGAWQILAEGRKEWQIIQEKHCSDQKVNAGVERNVKRVVCKIEKATPFYINTNVDMVQIKLHKETLLFLPDKVFIVRKSKVGLVNYEELSIRVSQTMFVEYDRVPKDAVMAGSTWQYVNKNGTRDKRYSNNRQLPVCQYGIVYLNSDTGLNVEMMFSNVNKTQDFEELIR